jgi:hypothetical protein
MPEPYAEPVLLEAVAAAPPRGHPVVAWLAILAVVGFMLWARARAEVGAASASRAGLVNA